MRDCRFQSATLLARNAEEYPLRLKPVSVGYRQRRTRTSSANAISRLFGNRRSVLASIPFSVHFFFFWKKFWLRPCRAGKYAA